MKYNFDEIIPRRGTGCVKWDHDADPEMLPLWVADMDFRAATPILQAMQRRLDHGIFGYVQVPDSYYQAVIQWFARRHNWNIQREHMLYTIGVVPAIAAILQALTVPGDGVIMQTPVYNCFYSCLRNAGNVLVDNPLVRRDNHYEIDFTDFEQKIIGHKPKIFLLCNPHNPVGRVWTPEELTRLGDICLRHGVFVISDEIHNEIVMPGFRYTPFASLSDKFAQNSAVCISASKSFNIAGLQLADIVVPDSQRRALIDKQININETCDVNPFGVVAHEAAYSEEGEEWLRQLMSYIHGNYQFLCKFISENMPQIQVTKLEGTYLAWIDCSSLGYTSDQLEQLLRQKAHVMYSAGHVYNPTEIPFLRINLACPKTVLEQSLQKFRTFFEENG